MPEPARQDLLAEVSLPGDPSRPVRIAYRHLGLTMLIAKRDTIRAKYGFDQEGDWGVPGAYVLIGPPGALRLNHSVRARPGMTSDLLDRLDQHLTESDWFDRALLIRAEDVFDSTEAGYLEGRLHDACIEAALVQHVNRRDFDATTREAEQSDLDRNVVPPALAALELAGVPLDTAAEVRALRQLRPRKRDGGRLLLEDET